MLSIKHLKEVIEKASKNVHFSFSVNFRFFNKEKILHEVSRKKHTRSYDYYYQLHKFYLQ